MLAWWLTDLPIGVVVFSVLAILSATIFFLTAGHYRNGHCLLVGANAEAANVGDAPAVMAIALGEALAELDEAGFGLAGAARVTCGVEDGCPLIWFQIGLAHRMTNDGAIVQWRQVSPGWTARNDLRLSPMTVDLFRRAADGAYLSSTVEFAHWTPAGERPYGRGWAPGVLGQQYAHFAAGAGSAEGRAWVPPTPDGLVRLIEADARHRLAGEAAGLGWPADRAGRMFRPTWRGATATATAWADCTTIRAYRPLEDRRRGFDVVPLG